MTYMTPEPTHAEIDRAVRINSAAVVANAQALLQAALVGGGKVLVHKVETALQAGGSLMLHVGFLPGGAEVELRVEGVQTVEIFSGSGTLATRGEPTAPSSH